ncbi:Checkpoint kinase 2, partial [Haplosporangium gracile]
MTQTQILEGSDELPDDEAESPLLFGILAGRDSTMHQSLYSHEVPYTFGTSDDCDVKISHDHWPDDKKTKEPWFRLTCAPAPGSEATNQVVTTVQVLSSSGLYIDGSRIGKGKSRVLRWGDQIAGGPKGSELFVYTYKLPKDVRTVIATERTRYELEDEEMGQGMYSKVYKARDLEHDAVYACKVTNRLAREYNGAELASMQHEIELLKDLSHENIVKFVDVRTIGPKTYMFTELIEGVTLHKFYLQHDDLLTECDARHIFKQTCDAVNYLHMRNIVHRDIKSENVMVRPDMVVKLIDFGLARQSSRDQAMLSTYCGTHLYMAPETAVNGDEKNAYGPAVDVWALGVMLFRMLTGRYPFDEKTHTNGAATGKSNVEPMENEGTAHDNAEAEIQAEASEVEVVTKEETDMVGVERQVGKIMYSKRKPPSYLLDWKPIVDILTKRSKEVHDLLNRLLKVDPSQRIRIQHVLHTDWICMMDEELDKIDQSSADERLGSVIPGRAKRHKDMWGELNIQPGSISDAPRRIGLSEDEMWFGRRAEIADISENGTYINSLKIGRNRASQLLDGDELGLVVPPDPTRLGEDLRDRNNRYLKYKVTIYDAPAITQDQLVRRQYFSAGILNRTPSERLNIRKLDILEIPETGDWPPVDNAWATLAPINNNTAVERLSTTKAVIGRYKDCDVILTSNMISRVHCKLEWDEENRAAYLTNLGQNSVKVN